MYMHVYTYIGIFYMYIPFENHVLFKGFLFKGF